MTEEEVEEAEEAEEEEAEEEEEEEEREKKGAQDRISWRHRDFPRRVASRGSRTIKR